MSYKVISTFSGCGGSSRGYKLAGLDVISAIEFIDFQAETYRRNFADTKLYEADIRTLDAEQIMRELNLQAGELDILDGSPPCASFSSAGKREKGWNTVKQYSNTKQRTDDLFDEYIRFVKVMKPKLFIAENVAGLTHGQSKKYLKNILNSLQEQGYVVKAKVLNAVNYSIPQIRKRLIIVGVRNDIELDFVYPEHHAKQINVNDVFADIEYLRLGNRWRLANTPASTIVQSDGKRTNTTAYFSSYLVKHKTDGVRKYTIKELRTLQSFPDEHILLGDEATQWESIGRSVPPMLMKEIALQAKQVLDKYYIMKS